MRQLSRFTLSFLIAALAAIPLTSLADKPRVGDFALLDQAGEFHQLSRYKDHKAFVVLAYTENSETLKATLKAYKKTIKRYDEQAIAFFLLNTESTDRGEIQQFVKKQSLDVPILMDDAQLVAKTLGLKHSGEVAVLDPTTHALSYRGPLNDKLMVNGTKKAKQDFLVTAIEAQLSGETPKIAGNQLASNGSALQSTAKQNPESISFNQDIVPILESRCVACHREGGIAPFAMNSHQMIRGWAPMIREVIMSKRMPPGQIDPLYNHRFDQVAHLTIDEMQTLVNWIDAGSHNTEKLDALAELEISPPEWQLGEPDIIVDVPAQEIPATGVVDYRYEKIPLGLEKDIWVGAVEFLPSAHDVMHHIIAFSLDTPDFSELQLLTQGVGLGAYAPGNQPTVFPDNTGYKLSAGGGLFLQLHYTTSGKAAVDRSRIGLYLLDQPPAIAMKGGSAAEFKINIPANTKTSPMTADRNFNKDAYLVSLSPHMHFRGKKIKYTLVYPDGKEEVLLSVPNYQFNWQKNYDFIKPKFVPAGSRLVVDGAFDNSATNPNNPDPDVVVTWGEQSWNEMFFGFYRYRDAEPQTNAAVQ